MVQKGKAVPVRSMEACTVSRGTPAFILNLGTKWRRVVNIKFRRVIPGKEPRYPLKRGLGGPQSRSGRFEEEENVSPLPEFEPPDRPAPIIYVIAIHKLYGNGQRTEIRCVISVTRLVHAVGADSWPMVVRPPGRGN